MMVDWQALFGVIAGAIGFAIWLVFKTCDHAPSSHAITDGEHLISWCSKCNNQIERRKGRWIKS